MKWITSLDWIVQIGLRVANLSSLEKDQERAAQEISEVFAEVQKEFEVQRMEALTGDSSPVVQPKGFNLHVFTAFMGHMT
jgi:hypothetical protein